MPYSKPYEFRAGRYAKANEVNANFDTLKDFVDDLENELGRIEVARTPYNKANIDGDKAVVFECANSDKSTAAVNNSRLEDVLSQSGGVNEQISNLSQKVDSANQSIQQLEEQSAKAPYYYLYTDLPSSSGNFPTNGILYITNGTDNIMNIRLGTDSSNNTRFSIRPNVSITLPVRQGGYYNFSEFIGNVTKRLFV